MKNMKLKNKEGITLIALIITVIIMLILAAITIGAVTGDGLFNRTRKAADAYENSAQNEADIIGGLLDELDKIQGVVVDDSDPGNLGGTGTENDPYRIESIEDLVAFSNATNGIGTAENRIVTDRTFNENNVNKYEGKYVKLLCYLDFESDKSYMDPKRKDFGDINGDGTIDELKKELTTKEGTGFLPVGFQVDGFSSAVKVFQGVFEGNNKEIANVYVNQPNMSEDGEGYYCTGGIFGYVNNATIKNLTVSGNVVISSKISDGYELDDVIGIGGIIGIAETSTLENLNNKVQMENKTEEKFSYAQFGGIVGKLANSIIKDSENNSSVLGRTFGGIVGRAESSLIDSSINNGKILNCVNNASFTSGITAGGVVYYSKCAVENCTNNGSFANIKVEEKDKYANGYAGVVNTISGANIINCTNNGDFTNLAVPYYHNGYAGIVNSISDGNVEKSINNGSFSNISGGQYCAGIANNVHSGGRLIDCINKGEMNISNVRYVGGYIAEITDGEISSLKNETKITGNGCTYIGGIVGRIENTVIKNCDNNGEITGGINIGGIVGNGFGTIENCKNLKLISGTDYCAGIAGHLQGDSIISSCSNSGKIEAINENAERGNIRAAGIVATGSCKKLENCYNLADIYSYGGGNASSSDAAGIACPLTSHDASIVNNCYNTGNIKSEGRYPSAYGILESFMYGRGDIYNCYNIGRLEAEDTYAITGNSSDYGIYNTYNLGELIGEDNKIYGGYSNGKERLVKNLFIKGTYDIGKPNDINKLFNIYNEKEFYSADGTYSSSPIDLKSQEFVDILNSFVDDYNKNVAEGGIILKRWKIDNSVEESQGYPIFE